MKNCSGSDAKLQLKLHQHYIPARHQHRNCSHIETTWYNTIHKTPLHERYLLIKEFLLSSTVFVYIVSYPTTIELVWYAHRTIESTAMRQLPPSSQIASGFYWTVVDRGMRKNGSAVITIVVTFSNSVSKSHKSQSLFKSFEPHSWPLREL